MPLPEGPDHTEQRRAHQTGHHLGHEPLAPEEERRVGARRTRQDPYTGTRPVARAVSCALGTFAYRLQLDHRAGETQLGAPQAFALAGRALGLGAHQPLGQHACALGGEGVGPRGHAAAALSSSAAGVAASPGE